MNNTEVKKERVPSLKLTIVSALVSQPKSVKEFPVWGEMVEHVHIP